MRPFLAERPDMIFDLFAGPKASTAMSLVTGEVASFFRLICTRLARCILHRRIALAKAACGNSGAAVVDANQHVRRHTADAPVTG